MFRIAFLFLFFVCYLCAENILHVAVSKNVGVLNPQGYGSNEMFAQNLVYEGLTKLDKKGRVIPSLAESWEILDSGKTYIFTLRKNVTFSNKESFNAEAVKKNFDSILKNKLRHSWANLATLIHEVKIIDTYHIAIVLKQPYNATLEELSLVRPFRFIAPSMIPQDLDLVKANPKAPIGTGAYMLTQTQLGISDTFSKNPSYWDKDKYHGIYFDKIITKIILEPNSKIMALKAGLIDMIYGQDEIPIEIFKSMSESTTFATYTSPPIFTTSIVLNPAKKPLDSTKIREAIALAIDKERLIKAVYYNYQTKADYLFAPNMPYSDIRDSTYKPFAYNPRKAREILESSGFVLHNGFFTSNNKRIELELLYIGNNPAQKAMAEILQSYFKEIGIFLKLTPSELTIFRNKQKSGNFDICFSDTWGVPYEPLLMLNSMRFEGHTDYAAQKSLPQKAKLDSQIINILSSLDTSKENLSKLIQAFLVDLYSTNIYIPLTNESNKAIANKNIKGINMSIKAYEIPFWEFYR